jgi:hypothetical protein
MRIRLSRFASRGSWVRVPSSPPPLNRYFVGLDSVQMTAAAYPWHICLKDVSHLNVLRRWGCGPCCQHDLRQLL